MELSHRKLLSDALDSAGFLKGSLQGASIYVAGGSGFLAASLIAFLWEFNGRFDAKIKFYASARRPQEKVPLFGFLGTNPEVEWQVAPVETAEVPQVDDLIIVHAASYGASGDYMRHPMATFSANTTGLVRLFEQAQQRKARQLVFLSSAEVYGQPPDEAIPTKEDHVGCLNSLSSRSIYSESKRMAEVLGTCMAEAGGVPFTVVRPWNIYGPGQRLEDGRVPLDFVLQAVKQKAIRLLSNGATRRSFCFVWDGIRQIVSTLGRENKVEAFNVGNGEAEISMLELARQCAEACGLTGKDVSFNPAAKAGGMQRCCPHVGRVLELWPKPFSFTPLGAGIAPVASWVRFLLNAN